MNYAVVDQASASDKVKLDSGHLNRRERYRLRCASLPQPKPSDRATSIGVKDALGDGASTGRHIVDGGDPPAPLRVRRQRHVR